LQARCRSFRASNHHKSTDRVFRTDMHRGLRADGRKNNRRILFLRIAANVDAIKRSIIHYIMREIISSEPPLGYRHARKRHNAPSHGCTDNLGPTRKSCGNKLRIGCIASAAMSCSEHSRLQQTYETALEAWQIHHDRNLAYGASWMTTRPRPHRELLYARVKAAADVYGHCTKCPKCRRLLGHF
jgi:hypothetical protein